MCTWVSGSLGHLSLCIMPEAKTAEKLVRDNFETIPEQSQYPDRNSCFCLFWRMYISYTSHLVFCSPKGQERSLDYVLPLPTAPAGSQTDLNVFLLQPLPSRWGSESLLTPSHNEKWSPELSEGHHWAGLSKNPTDCSTFSLYKV